LTRLARAARVANATSTAS